MNMEDIKKWLKNQSDSAMERFEINKKLIWKILDENKVESVLVSFDGAGDSGQVDNIEISPSSKEHILKEPVIGAKVLKHTEYVNGKPKEVFEEDCEVQNLIESVCYDALEAKYSGWETNDGAFGTFKFDVKSKQVIFDYNERITDVRTYETEFL